MNNKLCFNFTHELFDNLNIIFNATNRMIAFWNSYQIFVIDESNLEFSQDISKWVIIHDTDSDVVNILLTNKYLLYLDSEGNVYDFPLKLKHSATKKPTIRFNLTADNVLCMDWAREFIYTLKIVSNELYMYVHTLNYDFPVYKKFLITTLVPTKTRKIEKCLYYCYEINEIEYKCLKDIFNEESSNWNNQILIIVSFNKLTLYGMLVNLKSSAKSLTPIKLMTCPSEINDVNFEKDNLCLIIGLNIGTVINLPLSSISQNPNIAHLNTVIQKFLAFNNTALYTDGVTMWKAIKIFSENDVTLQQLFVTHVKDFIKIGDKIICTTYSKLVYIFNLDDKASYLIPENNNEEYCPAEHLLNNSSCLDRIMEEIEKNDDITKNITKEQNYITTLALSNRQDILNDIIKYNVTLYDSYQDVLKEDLILNLTHNIEDYVDGRSMCFLVKISTTSVPHNYQDILSNIFNDFRIYINIISEQKTSMTVALNVTESLKTLNILIPIVIYNIKEVTVNIKLISKIPGVLDEKQALWATLHSGCINLTPEYFIKLDKDDLKDLGSIQFLKKQTDSVENLIFKSTCTNYEHLFKFSNVTENKDSMHWTFYIKLPMEYEEVLLNETFFNDHFNSVKAKFFLKQLSSDEFLKSRSNICFSIANEKLNMKIIKDGFSTPLLSVSCQNANIALSMRNFFSNLINKFQNFQPRQMFLRCPPHQTIENTNKAVKNCRVGRTSFEEFCKIYEQYLQNVIAEII